MTQSVLHQPASRRRQIVYLNGMHWIRSQFDAFKYGSSLVITHGSLPYSWFWSFFRAVNPKHITVCVAHDFLLHGLVQPFRNAQSILRILNEPPRIYSSGLNITWSCIDTLLPWVRNFFWISLHVPWALFAPFVALAFRSQCSKFFGLLHGERPTSIHYSSLRVFQKRSNQNC